MTDKPSSVFVDGKEYRIVSASEEILAGELVSINENGEIEAARGQSPVVGFLHGRNPPTVESSESDFNTLGMGFRTFHDFGVGATSWGSGLRMNAEEKVGVYKGKARCGGLVAQVQPDELEVAIAADYFEELGDEDASSKLRSGKYERGLIGKLEMTRFSGALAVVKIQCWKDDNYWELTSGNNPFS